MRQTRSRTAWRTRSPATGILSRIASSLARPAFERRVAPIATTRRSAPPPRTNHHEDMKLANESNMRVGKGSLAFNDLKKVLNFGKTYAVRTITVTLDINM